MMSKSRVFVRVIPVVLSSFLLSGCFFPPSISVASWALDGLTILFTKKSITDHGISAITEKDCALWRGITEGEICREEDSITAIADAGDISNEGNSAVVYSYSGVENNSLDTLYQRSIISDLAFVDTSFEQDFSWQKDAITVVEKQPASNSVVKVEVLKIPEIQIVKRLSVETPVKPEVVQSSIEGRYLVIGSFGKWSNAVGFARLNENLGTRIVAATVHDKKVFRILVGPYSDNTQQSIIESVQQAGITDAWKMQITKDAIALNWDQSDLIQYAAIQ